MYQLHAATQLKKYLFNLHNDFIAATQNNLVVKGAERVYIPFIARFFCDTVEKKGKIYGKLHHRKTKI